MFDEGFGKKSALVLSYLTNEKMYLGILPEYRYIHKSTSVKFSGGVLLSADIANSFVSDNTILLPNSKPLGFKIGTALQLMLSKIGIELRADYVKFGPSKLINIYHPRISYDLFMYSSAIVYSF